MAQPIIDKQAGFLNDGGETGAIILSQDWSLSPLGPPGQWPQSLRTTLSIILRSNFPMFLFWGPELICFYNDAYREILGQEGKHPSALGAPANKVWPEIWAFIKPLIDNVFATGKASWYENQLLPIFRNGHMEDVYWTFSYSAVIDESEKPGGVFVTCVETTENVLSMKRLSQLAYAEERARLAIESGELGMYEVNLMTDEMEANTRFNNIFGFDKAGTRFEYTAAIHHEDLYIRHQAHQEAMETGYLFYEARVIRKDDTIRWMRVTGKVFYTSENIPDRILGVVLDVTEQKLFADNLAKQVEDRTRDLSNSYQELKKINAELEQYVHVSSHDLQEPLRKIRIYTDMIKSRDFDHLTEFSKNHFNKISAAAERLSTSLKDLLDFNSLDKDDLYKDVDLNDAMKNVENDLELVIAQKAAIIRYEPLPVIRAIPLQIHQLFYNLVNNALKFSKKSSIPEIVITTRLRNDTEEDPHPGKSYHEITVQDNGIGFDLQNADRIFNMFHRLHNRQDYSGTGIGLALCKKVVENHGGRLWAVSEKDKGAAFHILLPAV